MTEFGRFLREKRQERKMSQRCLSALLGKRGIQVDNTVISRWESGERSPGFTNRRDLIYIGEILGLTADEKDELLILADLAPLRPQGKGNAGRSEVACVDIEVSPTADVKDCDEYRAQAQWEITIFYAPFAIDILSPQIFIESVQVRTSDPTIPLKLLLFEDAPSDRITDWKKDDIVQMEEVKQRVYTWSRGFPVLYINRTGVRKVYGGISVGKKPVRFDMVREEYLAYLHQPVQYQIRLQYRLS